MPNILLASVTDNELLAGQVVILTITFLLFLGAMLNIVRSYKASSRNAMVIRGIAALLMLIVTIPLLSAFWVENRLYSQPQYTTGTTVSLCSVFAKGKAVQFEYEVNDRKYTGCNTFHPTPISSIKIPGGMYKVRYNEKYPGKGRIDFDQPINIP